MMHPKLKKGLCIVAIVVGAKMVWDYTSSTIPYNPGGRVDVEEAIGRFWPGASTGEAIWRITALMKEYPYSNRFRVYASFGEIHVSGREVVVYDKNREQLLWWSEWSNNLSSRSGLSYREYTKLTPEAMRQIDLKITRAKAEAIEHDAMPIGLWNLQKYGAVLVKSVPD